eukprot:TRINITY_DN16542_c0_g1_i1.p1 TRINITY_DN16542_c0_g1~~TRINITY_DN16542_c0_g1_i1.p1  ORF type:complete len:205 (+),score=62.97 TRINITY_DN16542_c0_g1_i1:87-617(+)
MSRGLAVVLVDNNYEVLEFHYSRLRLIEAGFKVVAAAPRKEKFLSEQGYWAFGEATFDEINPKEVKVLVIPGGLGCPDQLRRYPACLKLIKEVNDAGGVIGFICHGAWVAISAKVVRGKNATCHPAIKDDLENAGAVFLDQSSVVDGNVVSAQKPPDLPNFFTDILRVLAEKEKAQ